MNKITPHQLRDLDSTLPPGTECYLRSSIRRALSKYRRGKQPIAFVSKDEARSLLMTKLGRGLKRFLLKDMRAKLPTITAWQPGKMA